MNEFAPSNKLVLASVGIFLIGVTLLALGFSFDIAALYVLGAGIIGASTVLVYRLFKAKRNREFAKELTMNQKDERMLKIYVHAGNMAFWISMFAVIAFSIFTGTRNGVLLFFPVILLSIYLACALYYMKKF